MPFNDNSRNNGSIRNNLPPQRGANPYAQNREPKRKDKMIVWLIAAFIIIALIIGGIVLAIKLVTGSTGQQTSGTTREVKEIELLDKNDSNSELQTDK